MAFSLSSIPPQVILLLGQAFGAKDTDEDNLDAAAHYDSALFHLMTYWSGDQIDAKTGVPRLALVLKHVAGLMDGTAMPVPPAVKAAAKNPQSTVVEPPKEEPKPVPARPPMTADGYVILDYRPGDHLTTEQARERAGVSKARFSKLQQTHEFVPSAGVVFPYGPDKQRVTVWYAVDVDRWKNLQSEKKKGYSRAPASPEKQESMAKAREAYATMQLLNEQVVKDRSYMTYNQVEDLLNCSRSYILQMMEKEGFPRPTAKSYINHSHKPSALLKTADVENWIATSDSNLARKVRKARAVQEGLPPEDSNAVFRNGQWVDPDTGRVHAGGSGGNAPRPNGSVGEPSHSEEAGEGQAAAAGAPAQQHAAPKGWMTLRDVAEFLGTTETGVERMVRDRKFPKANRQNSKTHGREWAARQVVIWKAANAVKV